VAARVFTSFFVGFVALWEIISILSHKAPKIKKLFLLEKFE
jgi:hypothetical protein